MIRTDPGKSWEPESWVLRGHWGGVGSSRTLKSRSQTSHLCLECLVMWLKAGRLLSVSDPQAGSSPLAGTGSGFLRVTPYPSYSGKTTDDRFA